MVSGSRPEHGYAQRRPWADARGRVDVDDNGRFNYHLGELRGSFLRKRDDRYRLTWLGVLAYRLLVADRFSVEPVTRRFGLDGRLTVRSVTVASAE